MGLLEVDNEDLLGVKKEKTAKTAREALVIPKLSFFIPKDMQDIPIEKADSRINMEVHLGYKTACQPRGRVVFFS